MNYLKSFRSLKLMTGKVICLAVCLLFSAVAFSKLEEDNSKGPEKIKPRMSVKYFKKSDGSGQVKVSVWYKEEKKNIPVYNAAVNLYLNDATEEGLLESGITNDDGEYEVTLPEKFIKATQGKIEFTLIGKMHENDKFSEAEEEITIKLAEIEIVLKEEDSVKNITVTVYAIGDSGKTPVPDVEVKIGVKRLFSHLPLGEPASTDENGKVTALCFNDIPGDSAGNLIIVAKIEDHDEFGNIESEQQALWGTSVTINKNNNERAFWSSREKAPYSLIAVSWLIIFGVWGTMGYLVFQLFKIRNSGRKI